MEFSIKKKMIPEKIPRGFHKNLSFAQLSDKSRTRVGHMSDNIRTQKNQAIKPGFLNNQNLNK